MPDLQRHPVSSTLEQLLLDELRAHPIVVWLDRDAHYTHFIDALAARTEPEPGPRPEYGPAYYGCFVRDLDGHKIEAAFWDESLA